MDEEESPKRYRNGYDTYSLMDYDGFIESPETSILSEHIYRDMIRKLVCDRDRFIAVCLAAGYEKGEVAYMLGIEPAIITRRLKVIRIALIAYTKAK